MAVFGLVFKKEAKNGEVLVQENHLTLTALGLSQLEFFSHEISNKAAELVQSDLCLKACFIEKNLRTNRGL